MSVNLEKFYGIRANLWQNPQLHYICILYNLDIAIAPKSILEV
ncbi:MAG: hypothetical protein V7L05_01520 [Nostoc sp.]